MDGATVMPRPASSPVMRRYPRCSLSRAIRSTRRVIAGCRCGRPGDFGRDFAVQRRLARSRCQRRIVAGVTRSLSPLWRARGITVSSAGNNARSAQVSFGRAVLRRSSKATWWRSSRISASFHAEDRRDSLNHAGARRARRNTNRRHIAEDHRAADAKVAASPSVDLRGCRCQQPHRLPSSPASPGSDCPQASIKLLRQPEGQGLAA